MKKYNKIVRDKIPEMILQNGGTCKIKVVDEQIAIRMLIKKLHEESDELEKCIGQNGSIDELADIAEVLSFLVVKMGWSLEDLERVRNFKFYERGGFATNTILLEASVRNWRKPDEDN